MKTFVTLLLSSVALTAFARADDIEFTKLPQPVQSTVIKETHIYGPKAVIKVIRGTDGVYAVTVLEGEGTSVVYVKEDGTLVQQAPDSSTLGPRGRGVESVESTEQVITIKQLQQDLPRYQLLKKEHDKDVYLDTKTGKKVKVEHK